MTIGSGQLNEEYRAKCASSRKNETVKATEREELPIAGIFPNDRGGRIYLNTKDRCGLHMGRLKILSNAWKGLLAVALEVKGATIRARSLREVCKYWLCGNGDEENSRVRHLSRS